MPTPYATDLAHVHHVGFGAFARDATKPLLDLLARHAIDDGLVVDLGCGSGIWARALTRAGYDVLGMDISPAMIELARRNAPGASFRCGSILDGSIPDCRAVTCLGECVNYLFDERAGRAGLRRLFRRVHAALEPGGLFVFDCCGPDRHAGQHERFWESRNWTVLVRFEHVRPRVRVDRHITTFRRTGKAWRRSHEVHRVRLYRASDIARDVRSAGFTVRMARGYRPDKPFPRGQTAFICRRV